MSQFLFPPDGPARYTAPTRNPDSTEEKSPTEPHRTDPLPPVHVYRESGGDGSNHYDRKLPRDGGASNKEALDTRAWKNGQQTAGRGYVAPAQPATGGGGGTGPAVPAPTPDEPKPKAKTASKRSKRK